MPNADCRMPIPEGSRVGTPNRSRSTAVPSEIGIRQSAIGNSVLPSDLSPPVPMLEGPIRYYRTSAGPVRAVTVATGLDHPWAIAFLPDGHILVTERGGTMRIVTSAGAVGTPLTGVPRVRGGRTGRPARCRARSRISRRPRVIWLTYSEPGEGGSGTAVARARLGDGGLDSVRVVFRQEPKLGGGAHFGSRLAFSPDGHLFVTWVTGAAAKFAQDLKRHQGKVVRLDARRHPAARQPVRRAQRRAAGDLVLRPPQPAGRRDCIRSPASSGPSSMARWAATRSTRRRRGRNYGWPVISYGRDYSGAKLGEGTAKEGMEQPVHYWDPSIAPSGMAFYTGERYAGMEGKPVRRVAQVRPDLAPGAGR